MKLLRAHEMKVAEQAACNRGQTLAGLMENAGRAAAGAIIPLARGGRVLVLCGKGNNGGDGLVVARVLQEKGIEAKAILTMGGSLSPLMEQSLLAAEHAGVDLLDLAVGDAELAQEMARCDVLVDAVFGTGFTGLLPDHLRPLFALASRSPARIVALDAPSGMNSDNGFCDPDTLSAELTLAFGAYKPGLLCKRAVGFVGETKLLPIGIDPSDVESAGGIELLDGELVQSLLPFRRPDSHKGDYGKLLCIAGSRDMRGAARLAAESAARSGVGLCRVASVPAVLDGLIASLPACMGLTLPEDLAGAISPSGLELLGAALPWATAILLGCGLTTSDGAKQVVHGVLRRAPCPLVLDADALTLSAGDLALLRDTASELVLTPHMGEMARLAGRTVDELKQDPFAAAADLAAQLGATVVLKDSNTVVAAADGRLAYSARGCTGLAKGGSGDVLAGLLAGLLAQGMPAYDAARSAVWLHGVAAEQAESRLGPRCMLPSDVIAALPQAFQAQD